MKRVDKSDEQWRAELVPRSTRSAAGGARSARGRVRCSTRAGSGTYRCRACGALLFTAETKFDSRCGWPSFYAAER